MIRRNSVRVRRVNVAYVVNIADVAYVAESAWNETGCLVGVGIGVEGCGFHHIALVIHAVCNVAVFALS